MSTSIPELEPPVNAAENSSTFAKLLKIFSRNIFLCLLLVWTPVILFQTWDVQSSCNPMINWGSDRCPIASINLQSRTLTLDINQKKSITANISLKSANKNISGANTNISWTSSNKNIVSVNANSDTNAKAEVQGLNPGTATITVTSDKDSTKQDSIPVTIKGIDTIKLHPNPLVIQVGQTSKLTPEIKKFGDVSEEVAWHSENEAIAKVNSDGMVNGLKEGKTRIQATSKDDGSKQATATIAVQKQVTIEQVNIDIDPNIEIWEGDTHKLTATITGVGASSDDVTWTSSNREVAETNGQGRAVELKTFAPGRVEITATSNQDSRKKDKIQLIVRPSEVTQISFPLEKAQLNINDQAKLCVHVERHGNVNESVNWVSNNTEVATIDSNGNIIALANGKTIITATSQQDRTKQASMELKIPKDVNWFAIATATVVTVGSMAVGTPIPIAIAMGASVATGISSWQGSGLPGC